MNICLIGKSSPRIIPGPGIPVTIYIHTMAEQLIRLGHNVDVICGPVSDKKAQSYNLIEVGKIKLVSKNFYLQNLYELWFSFVVGLSLKKMQKKKKWDFIHFFENPAPAFSVLIFAKKNMPPFIFSTGIPVSGDDLIWSVQRNRSLIWRTSIALHTYVFRHIENITTSSHRLKEVVVARAKINPAKITVTPFVAAEPEIFHPGIDSSDLREKLGLRPDSMLVLSLGEVSPYKNQFSLVKAMPAIIAKHANTKFVFVGALDKDYYNQIQRFVRENSLEKYIFFTGFVKDYADLPKYYNLADIYVLLSCGEGNMPKTTMEAMACGKAIIVSDIPQNREGAIRGDEMLFVNPYDISAIANAINRLLTDHDLRRQLGEKAQRTINEYYTPEMVAKLMIEVYEGIEVVPKNWTGC